jgi:hypothetical protein
VIAVNQTARAVHKMKVVSFKLYWELRIPSMSK